MKLFLEKSFKNSAFVPNFVSANIGRYDKFYHFKDVFYSFLIKLTGLKFL